MKMSILNSILTASKFHRVITTCKPIVETTSLVPNRHYAARKGTRERKLKKKVKVEVQKVGFIPHNQRDREKFLASRASKKFDDSWKPVPTDDVYVAKYFKWKTYPFVEAVECHRETHHPDMYNKPDADLCVTIELNMQGEKKTRFVEDFTRIVAVPHLFDHGEERSVLAFSKSEESQKSAIDAGAHLSGGPELIKKIQNGQVALSDFQFVVAHPDILPELVQLRGLLKKKFPNPKSGTLDIDVPMMVKRFVSGVSYKAVKDEYERDFGVIETVIGKLDMDANHLEENYAYLIRDIFANKPKREGSFITRCLLRSPPSKEKFKIDYSQYLDDKTEDQKEDDEEEDGERVTL